MSRLLTPTPYHPRTSYPTLPRSDASSKPPISIMGTSSDGSNATAYSLDREYRHLASMPSRYSTTSTASSYAPPISFTDLGSGIPSTYLIAPSLERPTPIAEVFYQSFRLVLPCQGPSAEGGSRKNAIHFTGHEGYLVKKPSEFLHSHKQEIMNINTIAAALAAIGYGGAAGNGAAAVLGNIQVIAEAGGHLIRIGVGDEILATHHIIENHQKWAMTSILNSTAGTDSTRIVNGGLKGIVLKEGRRNRIIWVCDECYDLLLTGRPIPVEGLVGAEEFASLTSQEPSIDVILQSSASVIILQNTLSKSSDLESIKMEIKPGFFEKKNPNSTSNLFKELGVAIRGCRKLKSLEIICHSLDDRPYQGLKRVLECSKLERLIVRGMKNLLQGPQISMNCKSLKELILDGVLVNTEEAATNLRALIGRSHDLTSLRVTRAKITSESAVVLSSYTPRDSRKQIERLVTLDLSDNDLESIEAVLLVELALGENKFSSLGESHKLRRLDISKNPRIDDTCCRAILEKFEKRSHPLEILKVEGTSVCSKTASDINDYLHRCERNKATHGLHWIYK